MINNQLKECCYDCNHIAFDYDETTITTDYYCTKAAVVNLYCKHQEVCKLYIEAMTSEVNK